ncbi:MAG: glycosyltransferase [Bacteroidales bacterium]
MDGIAMKNFINKKILFFFTSTNKEGEWQYYHFIEELQHLDISFELFTPSVYGDNFEEELVNLVKNKREKYSIFMTASYDGEISVSTLKEIRKIGLPSVLICYDNLSIPFVHRKTAKYYDIVWLTSMETEYLFKRWGAKTVFIPYAANPHVYNPMWGQISKERTVGFIGSIYGNRSNILNKVASNKIYTEVYTTQDINKKEGRTSKMLVKNYLHQVCQLNNLMKFPIGRKCVKSKFLKSLHNKGNLSLHENEYLSINARVTFDSMVKLYSNFFITLNVIDLWDTYLLSKPIPKVHLRVFEVPMCGGLQITRRSREIESYFEDGKEILLYDTEEELIDKCRYYLKNCKDIGDMKELAYKRAIADHTWEDRFSKLHAILYK